MPQAADGLTPAKPVPAGLIATDVVTGESFGSAFDAADAAAEGSSLADLVADAAGQSRVAAGLSPGEVNPAASVPPSPPYDSAVPGAADRQVRAPSPGGAALSVAPALKATADVFGSPVTTREATATNAGRVPGELAAQGGSDKTTLRGAGVGPAISPNDPDLTVPAKVVPSAREATALAVPATPGVVPQADFAGPTPPSVQGAVRAFDLPAPSAEAPPRAPAALSVDSRAFSRAGGEAPAPPKLSGSAAAGRALPDPPPKALDGAVPQPALKEGQFDTKAPQASGAAETSAQTQLVARRAAQSDPVAALNAPKTSTSVGFAQTPAPGGPAAGTAPVELVSPAGAPGAEARVLPQAPVAIAPQPGTAGPATLPIGAPTPVPPPPAPQAPIQPAVTVGAASLLRLASDAPQSEFRGTGLGREAPKVQASPPASPPAPARDFAYLPPGPPAPLPAAAPGPEALSKLTSPAIDIGSTEFGGALSAIRTETVTAAPPTPPPAAAPELARSVAAQIAEGLRQSAPGVVEITLVPEELGRLRIAVTAADLGMTVAIAAERPETLEFIRRHVEVLLAEARDGGLGELNLSFTGGQARTDAEPDAFEPAVADGIPPVPGQTAPRAAIHNGLDLRL
ncbi:MAG: flagellar hook-length control protein FliK [Pseudomonadota bacterium]